MSEVNARFNALSLWVNRILEKPVELTPLGGDAGFRRYYRLPQGLLAVDAPPATENTVQFLKVAALLREHGVTVPRILHSHADEGFLLIEDWGKTLFGEAITEDSAPLMYGEALVSLLGLQQIPAQTSGLPHFNASSIRTELDLFVEWFIKGLLNYTLSGKEAQMLEALFSVLTDSALEQPQVVVHRDYHSRNLLLGNDGRLALIDFQDAVIGPFTYDLVSLLRDCYLRLPPAQVEQWALAYGNMAMDAGIISAVEKSQYLRWFDLMGLQRHIKVLGIFARLHLRDGKPTYLEDLPLVMRYATDIAAKYSEGQDFAAWFAVTLLPLCQKLPWYENSEHTGELFK